MSYKKIKKMLIGFLILTTLFLGGKIYLNNKTHITPQAFIPTTKTEYKIDVTQFKIKEILATNKMQSLEITVESTISSTEYDIPKFKFLDGLSKTLTSRKLELTGEFKGIFSYDLSKAEFKDNGDNTYTIMLNIKDVDFEIVALSSLKSEEQMSLIGRYFNSEDVSKLTYDLSQQAKNKLNIDINKMKTLDNVELNLNRLFKNIGIDMNKININIGGM
jgi:hypothetical protein